MKDKSARQETLADIWQRTADGVLRAVSVETPSASALNVSRQFLNDNGVTLSVLRDWRRGPAFDMGTLPTFAAGDDDNEGGAPAVAADPLKVIAPFTPTDSNTA